MHAVTLVDLAEVHGGRPDLSVQPQIFFTARRYAAMLWPRACLSVSVCPSLTVRSAIEIDERIELVFG